MTTMFSSPVDVDLGANPGRVAFRTVEEAREWIAAEQRAWGAMLPKDGGSASEVYKQVLAGQVEQMAVVATAINNAASGGEPQQVISALRGVYGGGKALHAQSQLGKQVLHMATSAKDGWDRDVALGFLAAATRRTPTLYNRNRHTLADVLPLVLGSADYRNVLAPPGDPRVLLDDAIKHISAQWQEHMAASEQRMNQLGAEFNKLLATLNAQIKAQDSAFAVASEQRAQSFDERSRAHDDTIKEIENIYHQKVQAEAPAEYWRRKRLAHLYSGVTLCALFGIAAIGIAFYAFVLGSDLFADLAERFEQASEQNAFAVEYAIARMLVFIIPGFFLVWGLRILLRLGLVNLGLADDAAHRYTLTLMFRSLLQHERENVSEADRILMLQALFRPTPGVGEDESAPPTWFDTLLQRIKKQKGE